MIDGYAGRDAASLIERRWFSSITAVRTAQAECEVLPRSWKSLKRPGGADARILLNLNTCATHLVISWRTWMRNTESRCRIPDSAR